MISNKDRNNKGRAKGVEEDHRKPETELGARALRRKSTDKKVKRLKIKK